MRWEERVDRMMELYCSNIKNPVERVCLKQNLFYPLAKLPEAVEEMVSQDGNICGFFLKYLSKQELAEIEKSCTENLVLSRLILSAFYIAGRIDVELKKVISGKPSIFQKLHPWTRSGLLQAIADDIWQNIFDALLDNPEMKKIRDMLLQDLFMEEKNETNIM